MTTIFTEWQSYLRDVVPRNASHIQKEECRRAFYAGALASFALTLDAGSVEDEEVAAANLKRLQDEIRVVTKDLRL